MCIECQLIFQSDHLHSQSNTHPQPIPRILQPKLACHELSCTRCKLYASGCLRNIVRYKSPYPPFYWSIDLNLKKTFLRAHQGFEYIFNSSLRVISKELVDDVGCLFYHRCIWPCIATQNTIVRWTRLDVDRFFQVCEGSPFDDWN